MKTRLHKILSIFLVAVMLLTAAPLSGFVGLKVDNSSFSTKASAASFLSELEAERFVNMFLDQGLNVTEEVYEALTGQAEGSPETWAIIADCVEGFAGLASDINWNDLLPDASHITVKNINCITGAISGIFQIVDSVEGITQSDNALRKCLSGIKLIKGFCDVLGVGSYFPSTLSLIVTSLELSFDIAGYLETQYFKEAVTLYESELMIEYYAGYPLTYKTASIVGFKISQEEAQFLYDAVYFKYYFKRQADLVGAGSGSGSGGGNVDIPAEYIEMLVYSYELLVGETINNPATVYPTNATNRSVTYSSSNTSVATVDSNGNITAKGGGSANIIVTASNGVTNYCEITVFPFKASIVNGTYQIDRYVGSGGDVTIPGKIKGVRVATIGDYAFSNCTNLTSVTIPDNVTTIGEGAFAFCDSLTSVTISNSVTAIGNYVFDNCISLSRITVNSNNQYYSSDSYGVLYNKNKTKLIQYPIGNKRTSFIIPDSVTTIGDFSFRYCENLISVTISDSVTTIGDHAFVACNSLTNVSIGNSVTVIGDYTFYFCTSLTSVTIPDSVTTIGNWAFKGCTSLTSVTIPDNVTSIGDYTFSNCTNLITVTIGNSVTSIGESAFSACTSLIEVNIKDIAMWCNVSFSTVSSLGVNTSNPLYYAETLKLNGEKVTDLVIPDSVTRIGNWAFNGCTSLTSVTIPDSVITIGDYAFSKCTRLTNITISDSVTAIGTWAFYACDSLTSVVIPDGVTVIGNAFVYCDNLVSVTIPDSVTTIGDSAFCYCTGLTSITIPDSVTTIGDKAFYYCTGLTSITIPDSVTTIGDYVLYECRSLTDVCFRGTQYQWNNISVGKYNDNLINDVHFKHAHSFDWTVNSHPSSTQSGIKTGFCSVCNGCTFCDGVCEVELPALEFSNGNVANIDFDSNTISGFDAGSTSLDGYVSVENGEYTFVCDSAVIGTGTVIELTDGEVVVEEFTAVIFGDVNGDGWYDGTDSIIVSCLANGLLSKDDVSPAFYTAADCNHDGVIDSFDVALLEKAGILLADVDQSKSSDELATDEAYIEYLDLIDQSPETELEEEETPKTEDKIETPETEEFSFFEFFIGLIKKLIEFILSYIPVPLK